jgi:hypothetical protein
MDKVLAVTRDPGNRWHGTAIEAMVIQLMSMGGDNETGWNYMSNFVENLEGKDAYKGGSMHRWS